MKESDPRALIRNGGMTSFQVAVVVLCFLLIGLDGFDVLVIAYTAPSIAREWSLGPATLGMVFSAGLLGMGLGNAFVAPIADKVGRKPIAVLSLVVLAIGMLASGFSQNSTALAGHACLYRHRDWQRGGRRERHRCGIRFGEKAQLGNIVYDDRLPCWCHAGWAFFNLFDQRLWVALDILLWSDSGGDIGGPGYLLAA
jgi:MFS family permease